MIHHFYKECLHRRQRIVTKVTWEFKVKFKITYKSLWFQRHWRNNTITVFDIFGTKLTKWDLHGPRSAKTQVALLG